MTKQAHKKLSKESGISTLVRDKAWGGLIWARHAQPSARGGPPCPSLVAMLPISKDKNNRNHGRGTRFFKIVFY
jgi:hypothetical protein